jgi:hypothetical protein
VPISGLMQCNKHDRHLLTYRCARRATKTDPRLRAMMPACQIGLTGANCRAAPSVSGECRTKAIWAGKPVTEKEICRDRSGNGLFLGRHFKAR